MKRLALFFLPLVTVACASLDSPDAAAGVGSTLLIGNKGEDTLSFLALDSGQELVRQPTGRMPHEIAVSPDGAQAAVVAYGGNTIDVFDLRSRTRVRTINLGDNRRPHGLLWLPDGRLVATAEGSQTLVVVDTRAGDRLTAVPTGQPGSHMVAVTPDLSRAFVANIPAGTVTAIDLSAGRKIGDIRVGGRPEGIAVTGDGREIWVGDLEGARVQMYDARTFAKLDEAAVGAVPIRVIASPDGRTMATSNMGDGSITLIDRATRRVTRSIPVSGSRDAAQVTILFSPDGRRLYVAETGRDQVAEVDLATGAVLRRLPAGRQGDGLAIAP